MQDKWPRVCVVLVTEKQNKTRFDILNAKPLGRFPLFLCECAPWPLTYFPCFIQIHSGLGRYNRKTPPRPRPPRVMPSFASITQLCLCHVGQHLGYRVEHRKNNNSQVLLCQDAQKQWNYQSFTVKLPFVCTTVDCMIQQDLEMEHSIRSSAVC